MILANAEWTNFARTVQRFLDSYVRVGSAIDLAHDAAMPSRVLNNGCDRSSNGDFGDAVGRSMVFSAAPADYVSDEDIAAGDLVQWECDGRLMFAEPRRVVSISENGKYVYVEGHATPLSTAEVTAVEANEGRLATPAALVPQGQKITATCQDMFTLKEGQILMQFPSALSAQSFDDFTDWLILQHRKIGRFVQSQPTPKLKRDDA